MRKIYFLKTCDTCKRILKKLPKQDTFIFHEIKEKPLEVKELEYLKSLSGNYQSLFSKRAKLYKEMGLKDENLSESDFKRYILEHYTFINRPIIVIDNQIFTGNSEKNIQNAIDVLSNE